MSRRAVWTCVWLFLASQALFLIRIGQPHGYVFDEVFYIPAAQGFLTWTANLNRQHPPLAKYLIALSLKIFGDNPFGWRAMSSLFGGLTVCGMYAWAMVVLRQHRIAVWVAVLTLLNQLLYIHARTGMLEVFMFGFMVWGLAAFCAAWASDVDAQRAQRLLFFAGVMFGLTTACKWLGVVPWGVALGLIVIGRLIQHFRPFHVEAATSGETRHAASLHDDEPWITADTLRGVGFGTVFLALVVAPLAAYWATFVPLLWMPAPDGSWAGLWQHQVRIWQERGIIGPPVQITRWYQWPLNTHAMMYWYQGYGWQTARTVVLRGNPVVLWGGLAALLVCAWRWLKTGSRQAFLIVFWYSALYFSWAVIPRKTTFYYYYYPAAMALTLALGYAALHWPDYRVFGVRWQWLFTAAAVVAFAILLPTSSAMRIPSSWLPW